MANEKFTFARNIIAAAVTYYTTLNVFVMIMGISVIFLKFLNGGGARRTLPTLDKMYPDVNLGLSLSPIYVAPICFHGP